MRLLVLIVLLAGASVLAETEIYRCVLEDGTMSFQGSPCPEPVMDAETESDPDGGDSKPVTADDDAFDFVNPFDEPDPVQAPPEPGRPEPVSQDRTECEQAARNAIDAIDLEIRDSPDTDRARQAHLSELLELTRQLRACKAL